MKRLLLFALSILALAGCATGAPPLTAAQAQQNVQTALYYLQAAGCLTSSLGALAAPIVTIAADAKGQQVLSAVSATGRNACTMTVPASALPAPAAAGAPPVAVPIKS